MDKDMKLALDKYIERIKEDYKGWTGRGKNDQVNKDMTEKFCNSISIKE